MQKKGITLRDILAHIQGIGSRIASIEGHMDRMAGKIDVIEGKIVVIEGKIDVMDQRLYRIENVLQPSFTRLQITVRDHGTRIRKVERKLVAA